MGELLICVGFRGSLTRAIGLDYGPDLAALLLPGPCANEE